MSYTNALQVFFERLNYKHGLKGESFRDMAMDELDKLLFNEIDEWKESDKNTYEEIWELTDIMVCCVLKLEQIFTKRTDSQ